MGDFEALALASVESTLKYHPFSAGTLTSVRNPDQGQCQVGSLAGAVSSKKVTEEHDGALSAVGNRT